MSHANSFEKYLPQVSVHMRDEWSLLEKTELIFFYIQTKQIRLTH